MMLLYLVASALCGCEVFVMAPLDLMNDDCTPKYLDKFTNWCQMLRDAKVDGIMMDIWWGLTEPTAKNYRWTGYQTIMNVIRSKGLKCVPVFSFHKCGGSVGDYVNIPLPNFVWQGSLTPNATDLSGGTDDAYISIGYDNVKLGLNNARTPLEMYTDWMTAFSEAFAEYVKDGTIIEIEVGTGPCGEMRYPSYRSFWSYPGCGEFQSYDSQMVQKFKDDARAAGHSEWTGPPTDTGDYNVRPGGSPFWQSGYKGEFGLFFLTWYQQQLIDHAEAVLKTARQLFPSTRLSTKISGLHWQYTTDTHCAEVTAGYYNTNGVDGYAQFMTMFKRHNIDVCFTCLEMLPDGGAGSNPPALVQQVLQDSINAGLRFEGENALERYDWDAYNQIKSWVAKGLQTFTYLRMTDTLMNGGNWETFKSFVQQMKN